MKKADMNYLVYMRSDNDSESVNTVNSLTVTNRPDPIGSDLLINNTHIPIKYNNQL